MVTQYENPSKPVPQPGLGSPVPSDTPVAQPDQPDDFIIVRLDDQLLAIEGLRARESTDSVAVRFVADLKLLAYSQEASLIFVLDRVTSRLQWGDSGYFVAEVYFSDATCLSGCNVREENALEEFSFAGYAFALAPFAPLNPAQGPAISRASGICRHVSTAYNLVQTGVVKTSWTRTQPGTRPPVSVPLVTRSAQVNQVRSEFWTDSFIEKLWVLSGRPMGGTTPRAMSGAWGRAGEWNNRFYMNATFPVSPENSTWGIGGVSVQSWCEAIGDHIARRVTRFAAAIDLARSAPRRGHSMPVLNSIWLGQRSVCELTVVNSGHQGRPTGTNVPYNERNIQKWEVSGTPDALTVTHVAGVLASRREEAVWEAAGYNQASYILFTQTPWGGVLGADEPGRAWD